MLIKRKFDDDLMTSSPSSLTALKRTSVARILPYQKFICDKFYNLLYPKTKN